MPRSDFRTPRIYLEAPLAAGTTVALSRDQANYLINVLRLGQGDAVLLFNGRDGEWRASLAGTGKRALAAVVGECLREQPSQPDLHFLFAPLKHARLDYLVQKAVEMGVSRLQPVITRHTQVARLNLERMWANAIEAAQQCGVLICPKSWSRRRSRRSSAVSTPAVCWCSATRTPRCRTRSRRWRRRCARALRLAVLIGPEGGFAEEEREALLKRANVVRIALGPRILRADTAAVAALALVQAVLGDWRGSST